jgi:tRNA threonylcarbamoyladenosine biosynthesis protein TsaE
MFVKGLASGLELDSEDVTSPSFALVNVYEGRLRLYHIDLYRLDEGPATNRVDLEELLTDEDAVIVIEWAERLGAYRFPGEPARITIEGVGDEERRIAVTK